jgi:hypothetical protein
MERSKQLLWLSVSKDGSARQIQSYSSAAKSHAIRDWVRADRLAELGRSRAEKAAAQPDTDILQSIGPNDRFVVLGLRQSLSSGQRSTAASPSVPRQCNEVEESSQPSRISPSSLVLELNQPGHDLISDGLEPAEIEPLLPEREHGFE